MNKQRISIIGIGYVGLCTAIGFASKGYRVIAADVDKQKVTSIQKGIPTFHEPDIKESLQKALKAGNLRCTLDRKQAVLDSNITFITVGTPSKHDGSINLKHIETATKEIGEALAEKKEYHLIVVKSTVIPGTTENTVKPILKKNARRKCGKDFGLCMNPEFIREGSALHDTLYPDRIVIGEHDKKSGNTLLELYKESYCEKTPPIIRTNLPTAELIKYANNAFLATKISFINTIANICERTPGADVATVAKAIGLDRRIAPSFLNAGLGYGGSCFPKDVKALIAYSKSYRYDPQLLRAVENLNDDQTLKPIELCQRFLKNLKGKRIAILGLSFKPNTDDIREAKSLKIIEQLLRKGARITAYDPEAAQNAKEILGNTIKYASTAIECLKEADCCILVTEWEEFKNLKPEDFKKNMKQPILIDGRRIYNPEEYDRKLKFAAIGLGELA